MIKNIAIGMFVVVFTIFTLDYFKLMPNNKSLLLNHVSNREIQEIEEFSVNKNKDNGSENKPERFTDRVYKAHRAY